QATCKHLISRMHPSGKGTSPSVSACIFFPSVFQILSENDGGSDLEWTFYPRFGQLHTYHIGKRCIIDGVWLQNKTTTSERTVETCMGRKKCEIDSRNGILMVTPCDNPYACPEQSTDFHKLGSTRPVVNFGSATYKKKPDTFIPLQRLPQVPW
uniref:Uncharacterized protein n=1 Tax=Sphenodon punctatus TaxID=8508 RepID=A0A8D0H1I1_SPHPU